MNSPSNVEVRHDKNGQNKLDCQLLPAEKDIMCCTKSPAKLGYYEKNQFSDLLKLTAYCIICILTNKP